MFIADHVTFSQSGGRFSVSHSNLSNVPAFKRAVAV